MEILYIGYHIKSLLYSCFSVFSAVLFVVDKDKMGCSNSDQFSFIQTVKDLKAAAMHGHVPVPLIVVINKVKGLYICMTASLTLHLR